MNFHFYYSKNFIMISFHYLTNSNEVTAERDNALITHCLGIITTG